MAPLPVSQGVVAPPGTEVTRQQLWRWRTESMWLTPPPSMLNLTCRLIAAIPPIAVAALARGGALFLRGSHCPMTAMVV